MGVSSLHDRHFGDSCREEGISIEKLHPELRGILSAMLTQQRDCETWAGKFRPTSDINFLLIGESPPISGDYFYKPADLRRKPQSLPAKVFRGYLGEGGGVAEDACTHHLERLGEEGFCLLDWCRFPIDFLTAAYRVKVLASELPDLARRLKALNLSQRTPVHVVLPSGTRRELGKSKNRGILARLEELSLAESCFVSWNGLESALNRAKGSA